METEMDEQLGYENLQCSDKDDYPDGYKSKCINSNYGSMNYAIIFCFTISVFSKATSWL